MQNIDEVEAPIQRHRFGLAAEQYDRLETFDYDDENNDDS
jgi:hypothetical protein